MDTQELLGMLVEALTPVVHVFIVSIVGWVGAKLASFISEKTKNETLEGILARLNDTVWMVVLELEQTIVDQLKKATADDSPGGKKLTPEEISSLKAIALEKVKVYVGPAGVALLLQVLNIDSGDLNKFIGSKIESAVQELRIQKRSPISSYLDTERKES